MITFKNVGELILSDDMVEWKIMNLKWIVNKECNFTFISPSFKFKHTSLKIQIQAYVREDLFILLVVQANDVTCLTSFRHTKGVKRKNCSTYLYMNCDQTNNVFPWSIHEHVKSAFRDGDGIVFVEFSEPGVTADVESSLLSKVLKGACSFSSSPSQQDELKGLNALSENLKDLYHDELHCDLTVEVGERQFKAHKSILAARSPVLKAMMKHDIVEKNSNSFVISDYAPEVVQLFLLYLYSGIIDSISDDNVVELYKIANKYQVNDLKAKCDIYMKTNLSVDLFCDVVQLSTIYNETELLEFSKEYFKSNAKNIILSPNWQVLSKENHTLANELFLLTLPDV